MRPSEHLFDFGRPVAYYPGLVKHLGSVNAVLLFCQFFYWKDRTDNELGVYKSVEEIEQETGLSYREQATARKQLVDRGVLIETHKRLEHRIYYRIDVDRLDALLSSADCGTCNSRTAESATREETKAHFVNTEITTEITAKKNARAEKPSFDEAAGKIINLPEAVLSKWQSTYQAVNVLAEIAKAESWLLANPKNRKSDYVRFLNGWLSRAQDRAPRAGSPAYGGMSKQAQIEARNRQAADDFVNDIRGSH